MSKVGRKPKTYTLTGKSFTTAANELHKINYTGFVLLVFLQNLATNGQVNLSFEDLGKITHMSRSTVYRSLKKLHRYGYITKK